MYQDLDEAIPQDFTQLDAYARNVEILSNVDSSTRFGIRSVERGSKTSIKGFTFGGIKDCSIYDCNLGTDVNLCSSTTLG